MRNVWWSFNVLGKSAESRGRVTKRSGCICVAFGVPGVVLRRQGVTAKCFETIACVTSGDRQGRIGCAEAELGGNSATLECAEIVLSMCNVWRV